VSNGRITDSYFCLKQKKKGNKGRPRTRIKQQIWQAVTRNVERIWEEVDKDLLEDKEFLLLDASQNFEISKKEDVTSDQ
jgi:hypothetical protein